MSQEGAKQTSGNLYNGGVRGTIKNRGLNLCSSNLGSDSSVSAWVMMHPEGGVEYAQAGYAKNPNYQNGPLFFTQSRGHNGVFSTHTYGNWGNGDDHQYTVEYVAVYGAIAMYKGNGGDFYNLTPYNPDDNWQGDGDWRSEFDGETHTAGDDMPGISSTKEHFTNMKTSSCQGCGYEPQFNLNAREYGGVGAYKREWVDNPNSQDIWTNR